MLRDGESLASFCVHAIELKAAPHDRTYRAHRTHVALRRAMRACIRGNHGAFVDAHFTRCGRRNTLSLGTQQTALHAIVASPAGVRGSQFCLTRELHWYRLLANPCQPHHQQLRGRYHWSAPQSYSPYVSPLRF
jgi:hypothetical protein